METWLVLAAAVAAGTTVTLLVLDWAPVLARPSALQAYARAEGSGSSTERIGRAILARLPRGAWGLDHHLAWIALEEEPPRPAQVVGLAAVLGAGGLVLGSLSGIPALALMGVVGAVYPLARIRSRANQVRRQVERALPELSALMAAEMAAGNPPDRALERAGEWGGPLSRIIAAAVAESRLSGRPLFGRGRLPGTWREVAARYNLPALRAFAAQVDLAAQKGAAGPELMEGLARSLVIAYKDQALREAEKLDNRLAVPAVLFFFLPFLFLILTPLLGPVMKALS